MERRLKPVRAIGDADARGRPARLGPWIGWWTLVPLAIAPCSSRSRTTCSRSEAARVRDVRRLGAVGGDDRRSVALAGGDYTAVILCWLAIPVVTLSARFSTRGVYRRGGVGAGAAGRRRLRRTTSMVIDNPTIVIAPAALILAVAILSTALMRSDVEHRDEAVIDTLTGMLNRHALENRVGELVQQSQLTGQPVGLIVGDLDNFKGVNDSWGTRSATRCSSRSPTRCARTCAPSTSPTGSAARSS